MSLGVECVYHPYVMWENNIGRDDRPQRGHPKLVLGHTSSIHDYGNTTSRTSIPAYSIPTITWEVSGKIHIISRAGTKSCTQPSFPNREEVTSGSDMHKAGELVDSFFS